MLKVMQVADYLVKDYARITGTSIDSSELKLQKLMYFAQKTSLAYTGKPLFEEDFVGWVHGPVLPSLRKYFDCKNPFEAFDIPLSDSLLTESDKYIIDNTIYQYGKYAAWALRDMSHEEPAWIKSREGLNPNEYGNQVIKLDDIKKDAEAVRLYDHQFDMYIDEFEDAGEDFVSVE